MCYLNVLCLLVISVIPYLIMCLHHNLAWGKKNNVFKVCEQGLRVYHVSETKMGHRTSVDRICVIFGPDPKWRIQIKMTVSKKNTGRHCG